MALQRWRGDESLRLLREMADIAERGGEARLAAGAYARAVEVVSRMGGITGDLPEEELQAMLDRGRALVPDDDKVTRARLLLDEAWMSWRLSCNEEMAGPARAGLELARQTEDIPVLSSALDAVAALAWTEGKYGLAVEHARERLELLAGVRGRAHAIEVERSDALHMMIESLVATGDFRQASEYADQARELDLSRGGVFSGWARNMLPSFFLGEWDRTLEMARGFRDAWSAADHPPVYAMAAACGSAGAILGYRGNEAGAADWFAFSESIAPSTGGQLGGLHMMRADVDLHHGRVDEAAARLAAPAATTTWWRSPYAATRAEAMVRAGGEDAPGALTEAEALVGDHSYATGSPDARPGLVPRGREPLARCLLPVRADRVSLPGGANGLAAGRRDSAQSERTLARLGAPPPVGLIAPAPVGQPEARACVSRNREASVWSSGQATSGCSWTKERNSQAAIPRQRTSVLAVTVAERGPSSIRAISPMWSPGPRVRMISPLRLTVAFPCSITKKPTPDSPSVVIASPSANVRSDRTLASRPRSRSFTPANSGTRFSISATSAIGV